jgi:hypothetical protein
LNTFHKKSSKNILTGRNMTKEKVESHERDINILDEETDILENQNTALTKTIESLEGRVKFNLTY